MLIPELTRAAADLRRTAPDLWARFVAAIEQQSLQQQADLTKAPPEAIFVSQGRAQMMNVLATGFKDCLTDAAKLERTNHGREQTSAQGRN